MFQGTQVTRGSETGLNSYAPTNDIEKFYETVRGRRNVLHDYNLYNYNFTLVSLSKNQLENPESYKGKVFVNDAEGDEFFIVCRSGGFKRNNTFATGFNQNLQGDFDEGFQAKQEGHRDKDLYIENIRFDTRVGINPLGSSNITTGQFTIVEPYSSTGFYQTLYNAARYAGHPSYLSAPFLLVLSFYGRKVDENDGEPEIVPQATRYIPILIRKSEMNVSESGSTYNVEFMGANQTATSPVYSTTKAEIDGPTATSTAQSGQERNQTVALVLNDFFNKNNDKNKEFYRNLWRTQNNGSNTITSQIAERIQSTQQVAQQRAAQQDVPVLRPGDENNVHKYCIWFADLYEKGSDTTGSDEAPVSGGGGGASFPSNLSSLSFGDWQGKCDQILRTGIATAPYTNEIARQPMLNGALPRTGGRTVEPVERAVQALDGRISEQQRLLGQAQTQIQTLRGTIQGKLQGAIQALEAIAPQETPDNLETDLLASTGERADAASLNTTFASFATTVTQIKDNLPPRVTPAQLVTVNQLIAEINTDRQTLETATSAATAAQRELDRLNQQRRDELSKPLNFHDGTITWAWRQGIAIQDVINTVILESDFAAKLVSEGIQNIRTTEYVNWFRIEVFSKPIGFDPFTMDYQYEFHYIVVPYKIHYSQLPGLNIQFSTKILSSLAVREYNYIYTGKNVDVLDFHLNYNNLFFVPLVMVPPAEAANANTEEDSNPTQVTLDPNSYANSIEAVYNNLIGNEKTIPMLRRDRPTHNRGTPSHPNEVALAFQDLLYNPPSDRALLRARIKIVGDPVYIIGSGISNRPKLTLNEVTTEDGEMNAFSREVDVLFKFQTISDIPTSQELESNQFQSRPLLNRYNGVYQVVGVSNFFEDGQFFQELECLRRRNQENDYENIPSQTTPSYNEQVVEPGPSGGLDLPSTTGTQDGRNDAEPNTEAAGTITNPLDIVPSAPPNSAMARLIQNLSASTGLSESQVRQRIGQQVIDNRAASGRDDSGRGAEATTTETVAAAISQFPTQFPNVPNTPAGIAQVVSLFNQPLPTQDQLQQNIATPGAPRNVLDLINAVAGGIPNPFGRPRSSGGGTINLDTGARRYWGNVPRDEKVRITDLAGQLDYPLTITSSQRPEIYNEEVGGAERSRHLSGQAFDVSTAGWSYQRTEDFIRRASEAGYNGIDVGSNYIHIDTRPSAQRWGRLQSGADRRLADTIDQHREAPLRPLNLPEGS